ncbi:methylsterol monooxygenase 1-like [Neodiprion virginianus]|uniref:methylsterol monooxygenase 1-like n=1 Tax=Neodiprion virginianus TaxID=2961670 RepID=UPI001EE69916|nr:methylsterol monooxygenase 1-like [Neodiprion virginianus]
MTNGVKRAKLVPASDAPSNSSSSSSSAEMSTMAKNKSNKSNSKSTKKRETFDPMAVTWMEKYSDQMEKIWSRLPNFVGSAIATCAIFLLGATMRGEWLLVVVHFAKHLGYGTVEKNGTSGEDETSASVDWAKISLENFYLQNLSWYWVAACSVSYTMYFAIGGFLHWYFYVRQRDKAEEWKCQPQKWITPELERHEIIIGTISLLLTSTFSACLACYISNGGPCSVYYKFDDYSWTWWFLSWPVIYIYLDYATYWLHRIYHTPWLYKHFHKLHHKYKQPTAFSVTAIHPVEILHIQICLCIPLFALPTHWVPYCTIAMYNYYHGIIDHSGINFKAYWWQPWQPDAIFHDNHHQYFHVNFGFNCFIWDKIHGTYRQKDRIYTEDTYYGKGKLISEATKNEIEADMEERDSENPLAYRDNKLIYKISKKELEGKKLE